MTNKIKVAGSNIARYDLQNAQAKVLDYRRYLLSDES
jgi:hypothetical protein